MTKRTTSRLRFWAVLSVLTQFGWFAGCEKKDLPELPPATGDKAPAPPKIPTLEELGKASGESDSSGGARAGTGSLQALNFAALGPKETGILSAILVKEGDRVRKGQTLFRLDDVPASLALEQARTALKTAQVQQSSAKLDLERTQALRERGSVPQDALDQAKSRADAADSMVAQAQAAINIGQRQLSNTVVTSPIDGVVAEKKMNVGEIATMMPPSVVLVVQDIDTLELRARLPETSLKTVREGAQIQVKFPATGESRSVTIARIAPTVDPRTRTIEIVARIDNKDHRLKAGMLAEVAYAEASAAAQPGPSAAPQEASGAAAPSGTGKEGKSAARAKKSPAEIAKSEADRAAR